jgi:Ca2+-binding RTX toxin-like protein
MALIKGTADADKLVSKNLAADTLYGYEGDDTLDGGGGANRLIGGIGNDLYILHSAHPPVRPRRDEWRQRQRHPGGQ